MAVHSGQETSERTVDNDGDINVDPMLALRGGAAARASGSGRGRPRGGGRGAGSKKTAAATARMKKTTSVTVQIPGTALGAENKALQIMLDGRAGDVRFDRVLYVLKIC